MYGRFSTNASRRGYDNYGGDKAWPSPQSAWGWPPPKGFDGRVNTVSVTNGFVTLTSSVDATYNIRVIRTIELMPAQPVMRVRTVFERTAAAAEAYAKLGVWIDCQVLTTGDSRCYAPVPASSIFPNGYTTNGSTFFTSSLPADFKNANGLISFKPEIASHKLGFDNGSLLMVGPSFSLRIDAPRVAGGSYPDGGSSTEVYTTQNYFELEMLSPMAEIPVGGQMEFVTTYSLFHRTEASSDAEAQKILSKQ
jgi:hypothetical protein